MSIRVRLGQTGLMVSPICYGCWQLSPKFWGDQPQDVMVAAMHRAFESGVNFYDTADAYGEGYAETVLGKALGELPRDQLVVATKVFHHIYGDKQRYSDLSHDYILQACDASLQRMGMEYIDLYQCHSFHPLTPTDEIAAAMDKLTRQGKIRAYGTSNWTVEQMRLGALHGNFTTCQPHYNLLDREYEDDLLPYCQANGIGVLTFSSLALGILTGKFQGDETFTDLRGNSPRFKGDRFQSLCDRIRQCRWIADRYGLTITQLVLAITLMHPGIDCAIVGIKNTAQIEEAAGAMDKTIDPRDWHDARLLIQDRVAG